MGRYSYSMERAGGLFLSIIGAAIGLAALAASRDPARAPADLRIFGLGAAVAVAVLAISAIRRRHPPLRRELIGLRSGLALEVALVVALFVVVHPSTAQETWCWLLAITGLHFLPMTLSHGPKIALLGLLCMANAGAGLLGLYPVQDVLFADAAFKIAIGGWMAVAAIGYTSGPVASLDRA